MSSFSSTTSEEPVVVSSSSSSNGGDGEGDSQEERIAWLRKRGVLIEIPGERKTVASAAAAAEDEEGTRSVTVVRIPCNDTLAYEQIEVKVSTRVGGDGLLTALRPYFSSSVSDIDSSVLRATAAKQFGNADVQVSTAALQKLSEQGAVEAFTLDSPSEANDFRGVSLYLDEAGQLKSLLPNRRATALARACGFENVPLVGDMFVGRVRMLGANSGASRSSSSSDEVGIYSEGFVLAEMDSSASWIQGAQKRNYDLGVERGKVEMQSGGGGSDEGEVNGGVNVKQGYRWSETMGQVDVVLSLADAALTAKHLVVKFTSKSVHVSTKTEPGVALLHLNLAGSVSIDDCTWTASKGEVEISMEKTKPVLWSKLTLEE